MKTESKLFLIVASVITLSCALHALGHSPSSEVKKHQKKDIDKVIIRFDDIFMLTLPVDCEIFEFDNPGYKERIIQDRLLIDSLLHILYNLKSRDTNYPWTSVDTRAVIMLYSSKDSTRYCLDRFLILPQNSNSYYLTPPELIKFIYGKTLEEIADDVFGIKKNPAGADLQSVPNKAK